MSLVAKFEDWPGADQQMWRALTTDGGPLDDRGALAHLRVTSQQSLLLLYGRWIAWLRDTDAAALALPPADRATMARLTAWLDGLAHTKPMSRLMFVSSTLRVLRAAAPDAEWSAQRRLEAMLKVAAGRGAPERKRGRILSTEVLLAAGLRYAGPDADAAGTPLERAKRRRDGAMIAMLSLLPMRRRSYANLEIGTSIHLSDEIEVTLPEELTKTGVAWEAPVAAPAAAAVLRYAEEARPWLMARGGAQHDFFWVNDRGQPYHCHNHFGARLGTLTKRLTGVRVPPHFFRDAAATTLARISPDSARLIRPILGHAGFRTAERHYIHAQGIEAGREYAALIARLKKETT